MRPLFALGFAVALALSCWFAIVPAPFPEAEGGDKILHMAAFLTLTVMATLGFPRRSATAIFLGLTLLGAGIEVVQAIPAVNRDSDVMDLVADVVAIAAGLAIALPLRRSAYSS